jgi:hypothetical protein
MSGRYWSDRLAGEPFIGSFSTWAKSCPHIVAITTSCVLLEGGQLERWGILTENGRVVPRDIPPTEGPRR